MNRRILTLALMAAAVLAAYHSPRLHLPSPISPMTPPSSLNQEVPVPSSLMHPTPIGAVETQFISEVQMRVTPPPPPSTPMRPPPQGVLQMTPAGEPSPPHIAETPHPMVIECF